MKKIVSVILAVTLLLSMLPSAVLAVSAETITTKTVGDLDQDGEVTDWDGVLLARHLSGWAATVADKKILDIDGDGEITDWDGVMFDRHLAGWSVVTQVGKSLTYSITYTNTMGAANTNPTSYESGGASVALTPLDAEHYTFVGWYIGDNKATHIPTDAEGDLTIAARWTPVEYMISYANTKGVVNSNPGKYHIESDNVVLQSLACEGYRFDGWYNGNTKVTTIPSGTVGDITLTAQWTPISYTATFTADGSAVATRYFTIEDSAISNIPNVPSKAGYTGAWSNYSLGTANVVIPAVYTLNEYSITYANTKGANNSNLASYTVITDTFNLSDLQCDGYEFVGWYKGSTKVTSIEKGTTGNINITAKWTATDYLITYTDTKGAANANPVEYNVETGTIYLADVSAEHYTFNGWYLDGKKVSTIPAGNIGDIELVARWTPVSYSLTYQDTKGVTNANPATYTVEDMIILQDIRTDGYTFEGWYLGGEKVTTIPVGSYGNQTLTAKWSRLTYSITYNDEKNLPHGNPHTYTVEDGSITLNPLQAEGYTFNGWYNDSQKVTSIPAGSFGDIVLTAKWTATNYTITYLNLKDNTNPNPTTYTVADTIVLDNLCAGGYAEGRSGYKFLGWYVGDEKITEISAGSTGNLALTAKWAPYVYTISYHNNDDSKMDEDLDTYNPNASVTSLTVEDLADSDFVLKNPKRSGYQFIQWRMVGSDGITYPVTSGITADILKTRSFAGTVYLYAEWDPLYEGPLTYIYTASDFSSIVYNPSGNYRLMNDITNVASICDAQNPFTGYFDGNGYSISGGQPFGVVSGIIENLTTQEALATENKGTLINCVGNNGLVVTNRGTLYQCGSNDGYVASEYAAGGLVVTNYGTIKQCYSKGAIDEKDYYIMAAGGLACSNYGTIEDCYSTAATVIVRDDTRVQGAGLVVDNNGTIRRCYAIGRIDARSEDYYGSLTNGSSYAAGLVLNSYNNRSGITDCFYDGVLVWGRHRTAAICEDIYSGNNYYGSDVTLWGSGTVDKTGTVTYSSNFRSSVFIKNTLGWDDTIWNLQNGKLPTLVWETYLQ